MPAEQDLLAMIVGIRKKTGIPGISLAITSASGSIAVATGDADLRNGRSMTPDSRFEISCLMKFLLSLTILKMAEREELDLYSNVGDSLPELRGGCCGSITLQHLLSHTAGYHGLDITDPAVRWNYNWDKLVARISQRDPLFSPGAVFNYEHSEHVILGKVLERQFGNTARFLVEREILERSSVAAISIKAARSCHDIFVANHVEDQDGRHRAVDMPPMGNFWADSLPDLTITPAEACRIAFALCAGLPDQPRMSHWLGETRVAIPVGIRSDARCERLPAGFGLACASYGGGWLGHNGSGIGQSCGLRFHPRLGISIAVGVNLWSPYARDGVLERTIGMVTDSKPWISEATAANSEFSLEELAPEMTVDDLCGVYAGSYLESVHITRAGDGLVLHAGARTRRSSSIAIQRTNTGAFHLQSERPVSMCFSRGGPNGPIALHLGVHAYRKIKGGVEDIHVNDPRNGP